MNWLMAVNGVTQKAGVPACSNPECASGQWRRWKSRREGVSLNGKWYCSEACFLASLEEYLEHLPRMRSQNRLSAHRLPLGLLMLSRGSVDEEQLATALALQGSKPEKRIGECLIQLGATGEGEVTRALGAQHCLPVLVAYEPEADVRVPLRLQDESEAICFRSQYMADLGYVGFAGQVDVSLIRAIETVLQLKTEPCIVPARVVVDRLATLDEKERDSEIVFEARMSNGDIAGSICSYVRQTDCGRLRMGSTFQYVWAKLDGLRGNIDLLFRIA